MRPVVEQGLTNANNQSQVARIIMTEVWDLLAYVVP